MLNDVILCLLLQLPECIAYYLWNDIIKHMEYWQLTFHFSDFLVKFQNFLVDGLLQML